MMLIITDNIIIMAYTITKVLYSLEDMDGQVVINEKKKIELKPCETDAEVRSFLKGRFFPIQVDVLMSELPLLSKFSELQTPKDGKCFYVIKKEFK